MSCDLRTVFETMSQSFSATHFKESQYLISQRIGERTFDVDTWE